MSIMAVLSPLFLISSDFVIAYHKKKLIKEFGYFPKSCHQHDMCIKMHSFYDLIK